MSLDGKVATRDGDSQWISCEASRELAHHWRAEVDAVVVGIGTALADDPRLTARVPGVDRQPRRIVFDSTARLPLDSRLVQDASEIPLTVVVSRAAGRSAVESLEMAGAHVIIATGENEPARIADALDQLGELELPVTALMLEGGPHLAGAFLDAGEIDEARLFVAPLLLGGSSARDPLEGEGVEKIADAMRAIVARVQHRPATTSCSRRGCGSGERVHGARRGPGNRRRDRHDRRRRAPAGAHARWPATSARATRSPSTASA